MIPEKKIYAMYIALGILFVIGGIVYGVNSVIGILINSWLALLAVSIAFKKFILGAMLAGLNMLSAVITLYVYCNFFSTLSCKSNLFIVGGFTPFTFVLLWAALFLCRGVSKLINSLK